jgi:hypothetical protein
MRSISHKVKTYRRQFRLIPRYVLSTRIFLLVSFLALLMTGSIAWSVFSSIALRSHTYSHLTWVVLVFELPLAFGFGQLIVEASRQRYLRARPGAAEPKLRTALMSRERDRAATIIRLFGKHEDYEVLARSLIEKWEWHSAIAAKASDPIVRKARGFFGIPEAGNFASYLGGLLAVIAAIVVTLLDKATFYDQLPSLASDVGEYVLLMTKHLVFPFAAVVIPLAMIVGTVRSGFVRLLEKANDDYLSQGSFYSFINELLDMQELRERRLLMVTSGVAYWMFRLGTAPMSDLPKIYKNLRRSRRLGKNRLNISCATAQPNQLERFQSDTE